MRPRTKRVFIRITGVVVFIGISANAFAGYDQNLASVDRALLSSLQNLKASMSSVDKANEALRAENHFYESKIRGMKEALDRTSIGGKSVQPMQKAEPSSDDKSIRLTEKTLAAKIEAYQALNSEYENLLQRIKAKEDSLADFQRMTAELQDRAGMIQNQIAATSDFSDAELQDQIQNLEKLFRESQSDLVSRQKQKEAVRLTPESTKVVVDSEMANKELWSKMQGLESDLRALSQQWVKTHEDQSMERKHREDAVAGLQADIQALTQQLESFQEDIKSSPVLPETAEEDDQLLRDYHQHLQQQNQELHRRVGSLQNFLPDL